MKEINWKKEALEYSLANGVMPAVIIEGAMRHAAALVVDGIHKDVVQHRKSLAKEQAASGSNGETKIIQP